MKILTKKIIPYLLVLFILVLSITNSYFCVPTKASVISFFNDVYEEAKNLGDYFATTATPSEQDLWKALNKYCEINGFMTVAKEQGIPTALGQPWIKYVASKIDEAQAEKTEQENIQAIRDILVNGISFNDNSKKITVDNQVLKAMRANVEYIQKAYQDEYGYSLNIRSQVLNFQNGVWYNALWKEVKRLQENNYVFIGSHVTYTTYFEIMYFPKSCKQFSFVRTSDNWAALYNNITWAAIDIDNDPNIHHLQFAFDENDNTKINVTDIPNPCGSAMRSNSWGFDNYPDMKFWNFWNNSFGWSWGSMDPGGGVLVTCDKIDQIYVYGSLDNLKLRTTGQRPYFVSNIWNNIVNNSGDTYTIDNSNYNPVTYGDTINYVNNYYITNNEYPSDDDIYKWINDHGKDPDPTPTPTPTPTPDPDNPLIDPDDPTPTPTHNPDDPNDFDPWHYPTVSGNGTDDDTDGWSFWDFLKGIINFLKGIVEGIGSILSAITDWFTVDTDLIKTHVSGVIDGSVPLPNGVSYNGIVNEIIPVEDIKSIGKTFTDIPDGFVPGTYYPKLTIKTPQIIRQFYDEEEIVLLDFEEWASTFVIVRTLLEFSFWLAEIYYLLSKLRPVISIS